MTKYVKAFALAGLVLTAVPVRTHHSQTIYDETKMTTIVGVVNQFAWKNPHTWIYVDVVEKEKKVKWDVETNSAVSLQRSGWKRDQFKVGDQVTVTVNPAKNGKPIGMLRKVVGPDGKEFTMPGNGPERGRGRGAR